MLREGGLVEAAVVRRWGVEWERVTGEVVHS